MVSPDGRNVYVASLGTSAIAVFARNRRTRDLRQLRARAGWRERPASSRLSQRTRACPALSLALGPSVRFLYAGSGAGIAVSPPPRTGRLAQVAGADGCITAETCGCARGRALGLISTVALDPRGAQPLRDLASRQRRRRLRAPGGRAAPLIGTAGCSATWARRSCTPARTLLGAFGLAASPNGPQLYATAMFNDAVRFLPATRPRARSPSRRVRAVASSSRAAWTAPRRGTWRSLPRSW